MNSRKATPAVEDREEIIELARVLSQYRSAMRHVAAEECSRPAPAMTVARIPHTRSILQMAILGPALATAIFLAALPIYLHSRHAEHPVVAGVSNPTVVVNPTAPHIGDAELLSQIDAEISEDAPDALQPMADFGSSSSSTPTSSSVMEKNHATKE
jgi:hypothetical protein